MGSFEEKIVTTWYPQVDFKGKATTTTHYRTGISYWSYLKKWVYEGVVWRMKKLLVMMCILFIINLAVIIISLLNTVNAMTILYRMTIFCNLAIFAPSINLIYRELKK